ncbi:hypothetical protein CHUAL_007578 [Chamberlinius hualienensis]
MVLLLFGDKGSFRGHPNWLVRDLMARRQRMCVPNRLQIMADNKLRVETSTVNFFSQTRVAIVTNHASFAMVNFCKL